MIAFEAFYWMEKRMTRKKEYCAIKSDIRGGLRLFSCYNNKDGALIIGELPWLINCMTSISYSIMTNGYVKGCFYPFRGSLQREPLSSYLFIPCVAGLVGLS